MAHKDNFIPEQGPVNGRHSQVLALSANASAEEIKEYQDKKRRIFWFKFRRGNGIFWHNLFLFVLSVIWLIPIIWLLSCSFNSSKSPNFTSFFPKYWSFNAADTVGTYWTGNNYYQLLFKPDTVNMFPTWLLNTIIVSVATCLISTLFVLQVAFATSRMRFGGRKTLMNLSMIMGLFPGMLTMVCVYFLFQYVLQIDVYNVRLIIAYSASSGLGYLVAKGFFDTIPHDIDEAAKIDGASELQIFTRITVPLSKPIIVYTIITSFMGPWVDFMYARIILPSGNSSLYTVSIGLFNMLDKSLVGSYFGVFCAGAVVVSIPLSVLFMFVQKYYIAGVTGGSVKG